MNFGKISSIIGSIALAVSVTNAQTEAPQVQPSEITNEKTASTDAQAIQAQANLTEAATNTSSPQTNTAQVNQQTQPATNLADKKIVPVYYVKQTPPAQATQPQPVAGTQPAIQQPAYKLVALPAKPAQQNTAAQKVETKAAIQTAQSIRNDSLNALRKQKKLKQHIGVAASIGSTTYEGGEDTPDFENGLIWTAGIFYQFPLTEHILYFELGANVLSRTVEDTYKSEESYKEVNAYRNKIQGYSLAFPLLLNANAGFSPLHFSMGAQIETPLYNHYQTFLNGHEIEDRDLKKNSCKYISWDFVFGIGVQANKYFGLEARINYGISDIYIGFYNNNTYWSFTPVDLTVGIKISY